ncbi:30S ribosome-binding factor RbfA [Parvularcula sp. LCG005]|uniref:30S ribosome-binding factor RbfA n=1 Tax=Parvularcula sp. LCG005 TaxID=3078805 RepID=UPI0029432CF1|nr:30S ribosome-binding factor RbfA [Parvularcula sp. LCG005]WOI53130.1 30S ribosome-binding factor RbfA [Parvularcula sp. LCG005]
MAKRFSTTAGPSQRQLRAGELMRHVLAEIFQRGEVHDPDMPREPITISEVKASPDLRNATVFISVLGSDNVQEAAKKLNVASGRIRAAMGAKLTMKYTPQLVFRADDRFDEAAKIDKLLNRDDVKRDL